MLGLTFYRSPSLRDDQREGMQRDQLGVSLTKDYSLMMDVMCVGVMNWYLILTVAIELISRQSFMLSKALNRALSKNHVKGHTFSDTYKILTTTQQN